MRSAPQKRQALEVLPVPSNSILGAGSDGVNVAEQLRADGLAILLVEQMVEKALRQGDQIERAYLGA